MGYKVALLDVDGTLRHKNSWNPGALEMLAELHDAGVRVALCSGRTTGSMIDIVRDIPDVDYLASSSGATVLTRDGDSWRTLAHRPLPPEAVELALRIGEAEGVEIWSFTRDEWLISHRSVRVIAESVYIGDTPRVTSLHAEADDVGKILFLPSDDATTGNLKALNRIPGTDVVLSGNGYLDLVTTEAHAAKGGDVVLDALGADWADVIAIGDSENDRGMLTKAGLALCIPPMRAGWLGEGAPSALRIDVEDTADARRVVAEHLARSR